MDGYKGSEMAASLDDSIKTDKTDKTDKTG